MHARGYIDDRSAFLHLSCKERAVPSPSPKPPVTHPLLPAISAWNERPIYTQNP